MAGRHWDLTQAALAALIEVHGRLGPGLLESVDEECVAEELAHRGIPFARQVPIAIRYRTITLECAYKADLVIADQVLVELKAVEDLQRVHIAQTLTYLKLLNLDVALLVNFNAVPLKRGIRRLTRDHLVARRRS